ncbi:STAS/SEC14 domain-containing protein [Rhodoblastus acidophilus]|uniref:STAS/SEC14 domain-containing protein n=1 Tax=Candidatus Rhodoblastus alkanivorans TaxID=2954117 RepID=A0ABS9Z307_9HYPH|nr:STAS/SEC14 domain-containing protein [Candidatus Rhodoblastus alkanivorans]MCI4679755.1 STAS/SEC14 domain-containing protein [Candidatus Rhodoblastus alkanivorans]MCI4681993.1 STAS/SEC14 domain-containing protein [Candidatus Rhodoblastus alkanivorans]MDI4643044.1 STAS/SEC14 domain-containing protein [Rhodoblastus acidophilus]
MFRTIEGLPPGVLGLEAHGRVTHADYRDSLTPQLEAAAAHGPVSMIYAIAEDFEGFDLEAMWDDASVGLRHWKDFRRVAVVADQAWLRTAVSLFAPIYPCEFRLFKRSELAAAKDWNARPPETK